MIKALARLGPVEMAYVPFGDEPPAPDLVADERITLTTIVPSRGLGRVLSALRITATGAPWALAKGASPELSALLGSAGPDEPIIADGPMAAAALLPLARRRRAVYLAHNLESSFRGTAVLRQWEKRVLRTFSESWMPTHTDMGTARRLGGNDLTLRYVPNVVDVGALPVVARRPGAPTAVFVADFSYQPNREGLAFLLDEVMPLVWRQVPDASLKVVGRGLDRRPTDPRVHALGFVEDLDEVYAESALVLVPLLTGGGSPLKFVDGLARGLPVVSTSHAAALIEHGAAGEDYLTGADAHGFAAAVVEVLRGEHGEIGARGRILAERFFSVEALARLLADQAAAEPLLGRVPGA